MLPRVFDLFAQGDRTIDRTEGGLGIGLTIVQRLVELHGGSVTAKSEGVGKGSEFTVRFPSLASSRETTPNKTADINRGMRSNSRVLVVDDNQDMASGLAKLLSLIGHDVQIAYDGKTAVELGLKNCPDVILLDIGLRGMSGYEVARQLRQECACRDSLIIAITGYGQEEDIQKSKEAGFDHHLVKPIDYHALLSVMAR